MKPSYKVKLVGYLLYTIVLLAVVEVCSRIFLSYKLPSATFTQLDELIYDYYPVLNDIRKNAPNVKDTSIDILLLGASVLHSSWPVEEELQNQLNKILHGTEFSIHNAAIPAHTSRDSKIKMDLLKDRHFDLVIFYHGINDSRANNCKRSIFAEDYSHFKWYDEINGILKRPKKEWTAIPIAFNYLRINLQQRIWPHSFIPREIPRKEWSVYGNEVKSARAFRSNILSIYQRVFKQKSHLILPTFAYWYDKSGEPIEPDSTLGGMPIKIWGEAANVKKAIDAHNAVIEDLGEEYAHISVLPMQSYLQQEKSNFADVCHPTKEGAKLFAEILSKKIQEWHTTYNN